MSDFLFERKKVIFTIFLCVVVSIFDFSCSLEKTSGKDSDFSGNAAEKFSEDENFSARTTLFEKNLPADFVFDDDEVSQRILKEYGAVFVAQDGVVLPPKVLFADHAECEKWQSKVSTRRENFGGIEIELQKAAMDALLTAREEARRKNLNITARGTWAARRDFKDTEEIWGTRITPGLVYWTRRGKLSAAEAARIRALAPNLQIEEILRLEAKKLFFSKDFSKSVLQSATPPGASQHLSMLAVDINENSKASLRSILARLGWFQTVVSDAPHFTYLGTTEEKLPALGLKKTVKDNRVYWSPE